VGAWWDAARHRGGLPAARGGREPVAAASAGLIDVPRTARDVFLASGALAGLAGAVEVTGVTFALYENLSPGYGYTAIAVALLARLNRCRARERRAVRRARRGRGGDAARRRGGRRRWSGSCRRW
jgi:ABC-type uncharacterized transport system permease subunit